MTFWLLIRRSLRFHARSHIGVVLGAVIGSATLIGALIVGDSVRGSLKARALSRLGQTYFAMSSGDRFFQANLAERFGNEIESVSSVINVGSGARRTVLHYTAVNASSSSTALMLPGTAARQDGTARANRIALLGVDTSSWPKFADWRQLSPEVLNQWRAGELLLVNQALARQLNAQPGDEVIVRVRKPTALAEDAVITPHDQSSVALRLKLGPLLLPEMLADFGLSAAQTAPLNAFVALDALAAKVELAGQANLIVHGPVLEQRPLTWWKEQQLRFGIWVSKWRARGSYYGPLLSGVAPAERSVRRLNEGVKHAFVPGDAQLLLRTNQQPESLTGSEYVAPSVDLTSSRVFLEPSVITAALTPRTNVLKGSSVIESDSAGDVPSCQFVTNGVCILTYLANLLQAGGHATPYSMVTAADAPFVPSDMRPDEIVVNEWLAEDLQVKPGDQLELVYYAVDSASRLTERTNAFRVRAVVPQKGIYADRTLMPDFPGVAKAESTHEWDTGFPLVYKIRDKDEAYWKQYRGTPKAFITLAAGQSMWASRFGSLTAIRYPVPTNSLPNAVADSVYRNLLANLDPAELGLQFEPVREQALRAADQAQDFGDLFLGFSLFLVVAALLLVALLFQFSLEQRASEVGTLLALGFTSGQVRRLLLGEGAGLAIIGGLIGALGGIGYAVAMLWGLETVWHSAVAGADLRFHVTVSTLFIGFFASTIIAVLTIWMTLRRQARQPARELLMGELTTPKSKRRGYTLWLAMLSALLAITIVGWMLATNETANAGAFFGAGSLLLVSGLGFGAVWLTRLDQISPTAGLTLSTLAVRSCARRRKRSLTTMALLASGCFVVAAIGAFRLDANQDAARRTSGTGGFALIGEPALPMVQDLNIAAGRDFFGISANDLAGSHFVAFRVHDGDEASCLNLNRAQRPRLLGVKPDLLAGRFTFSGVAKGLNSGQGWQLLTQATSGSASEIPAIADANSIEWALGKKLGDSLDYTDANGRSFKLRLVGAIANSVLQGSLIIDEDQFSKRFPGESGYRMFLIDSPPESAAKTSSTLARALQDFGLQLTPAVQRLNSFNAVQNTYLGTFQILGGLGILLGSAGLGVVVLRNVLERRSELGLLLAVGFRRRQLQTLVLCEHTALLALGLALGLLAAAVAVLPSLITPATHLPYTSLGLTFAAICFNGVLWAWLATRTALRGNLLEALRNE